MRRALIRNQCLDLILERNVLRLSKHFGHKCDLIESNQQSIEQSNAQRKRNQQKMKNSPSTNDAGSPHASRCSMRQHGKSYKGPGRSDKRVRGPQISYFIYRHHFDPTANGGSVYSTVGKVDLLQVKARTNRCSEISKPVMTTNYIWLTRDVTRESLRTLSWKQM